MMEEFKALGDRCKAGEEVETLRKAKQSEVIVVRLDGKGFSKFTKGLQRPYDTRMSQLMIDTVKYLVTETPAIVGFSQSDEITLIFTVDSSANEDHYFGGKFQKIATTCASLATGFFCSQLANRLPEKSHLIPTFDGRAWAVPGVLGAYNNLLWRERDATKNSITMAATSVIPHGKLQGINGETKKQMMLELGIDWNDYPAFFTRGTYVKRVAAFRYLTSEELERIPAAYRPVDKVECRAIVELNLPPIDNLKSWGAILFNKNISHLAELRDGSTVEIFKPENI